MWESRIWNKSVAPRILSAQTADLTHGEWNIGECKMHKGHVGMSQKQDLCFHFHFFTEIMCLLQL